MINASTVKVMDTGRMNVRKEIMRVADVGVEADSVVRDVDSSVETVEGGSLRSRLTKKTQTQTKMSARNLSGRKSHIRETSKGN